MITRALDRRQWSLIAEVGQVLDGVPSAQHEALSTALGAICAGDTIGQLRHHLASCSIDDFRQLLPLLRALPAAADEPLLLLLTNLPDGAVQEELAALLKARGVDLTLFYNRRLRGDDPAQIESAVKALGEIGSPQAVDACRRLLRHAEVRVRLAVLNAVGDKLRAKDIGALIGNLADNSTALRQACLELLERFPGDESSAAALLQQVKANAFDAWRKPDRQRLLQLLVRWGGPAIDPFIVQTITAANPLKRKKAAERRDEMFEAVQRVGGKRCKRLLEACLAQRRLPEKLQRGIHKVLERLQ